MSDLLKKILDDLDENMNEINNNNENIDENIDDNMNDNINENIDENINDNINENIDEYIDDELIIGIDLGTTNSSVGIFRNNNFEIIPDEYGNKMVPSFVAYSNISRYIGKDAKNQKDLNSENVFYEVKRLIGKKIDDKNLKNEIKLLSYNIIGDENKNVRLISTINNNKTFTPEEIQASILLKLKNMASNYLKKQITKCVISIPANFNDSQRLATLDASKIAGLECIRMINEPVCASLSYGILQKKLSKNKENIFIVYDYGGGTLDISLMSLENGIFDIMASSGNTNLGGNTFDKRLMSYAIAKFERKYNIEVFGKITSLGMQDLRQSCEQAKKILSTNNKSNIMVKNFYDDKDLFVSINRNEFENICYDLFILSLEPLDNVLNICNLNVDDVDEIIMVGGMSKLPKIRQLIKNKFNKEPNFSVNCEEAIVCGASIQAFMLSHDTDPFSDSITLLNKTSLSLGIETHDDIMDVIIERGTIIPCESYKLYTTNEDNMTSVMIKIYEGERKLTIDNFFIGEFELTNIKPQLRGTHEINVKFEIDVNNIITVTAENMDDNNTNVISVVSNKGRLTKNELENLIEESKELEIKDEIEKNKKLYYYEIHDICNSIIVNLKQIDLKLSDMDKSIISEDIFKIKEWLDDKKYKNIEIDEYENIIKKLRKRYGMLNLKGNKKNLDNLKEANIGDNDNSKLYDDEISDDTKICVFDEYENSKLGITGMSDNDKQEIKDIRQNLMDLCYSIYDIITSGNLNLTDEHTKELKDYIDDTLLWVNVHHECVINEYKIKIDEINEQCNNIFEFYEDINKNVFVKNTIEDEIKNKKDELENLCLVINLMFSNNSFHINTEHEKILHDIINENLIWIMENENNTNDEFYLECSNKIDVLNEQCNLIEQQKSGINFDKNTDIFGNSINIICPETTDNNVMGTSLIDIIKQKQYAIIDNLLNDNNNTNIDNNIDNIYDTIDNIDDINDIDNFDDVDNVDDVDNNVDNNVNDIIDDNIDNIDNVDNVDNVDNIDNFDNVDNVNNVNNVDDINVIDNVNDINDIDNVDDVDNVDDINDIDNVDIDDNVDNLDNIDNVNNVDDIIDFE
jgi:molecular chaperone DnaK (HSP70)